MTEIVDLAAQPSLPKSTLTNGEANHEGSDSFSYNPAHWVKGVLPSGMPVQKIYGPTSHEAFLPIATPPAGTYLGPMDPADKAHTRPKLFEPFKLRGLTFKNRMFLSPMAMNSSAPRSGMPGPFHLVHYGQFALRGAGLIMAEATAVSWDGGITPSDAGLFSDAHVPAWRKITDFVHSQGSYMGVQLNYAGRRGNMHPMDIIATNPQLESYEAPIEAGGWGHALSPSAIPFHDKYPVAVEMTLDDIERVKADWKTAVLRAKEANFDVIEIHASHGYLLHCFLTPLANQRKDKYGGSLENRMRLILEIAEICRENWPEDKPVFLRLSASDWHAKGEKNDAGEYISWHTEQSAILVKRLSDIGIDLVDISSGGTDPFQTATDAAGHNVPLARSIRKAVPNMPLSCVGLIRTAEDAESYLQENVIDVVTIAREFLRNPEIPRAFGQHFGSLIMVPQQYLFALHLKSVQTPGPVMSDKH